jgi:hypothetical protein
MVDEVRSLLGAETARVHVADYGLRSFQPIQASEKLTAPYPMEGTVAGRSFANGEIVAAGATWWVPLVEATERLGVLELGFRTPPENAPRELGGVVATLVLMIVSMRRHTDVWTRARRAQPLSAAAEAQWDLLPPLSTATEFVAVSGILEPAYEIGGDSFDYALNPGLELAIVDAVGHGMSSVLMSSTVINSLRNARRERSGLEEAYRRSDQLISERFGNSNFVTGQIGSLDVVTGVLSWINAGHVLPLLVRNATCVGELQCAPSSPMGLGGPVAEIAQETLQRGDRVLFYTDGITESRSPSGGHFGRERLADFLVRASLDGLPAAETVRRLSAAVIAHVGQRLRDDATLLLVEYRPASGPQGAAVHR